MTNVTHKQLLPGVRLTAVQTQKFKTCFLGVTLLAPLRAETAAANALLPALLRRGTAEHPDMERLNAALDELYGGSIEPMVRRKGEVQCVGFAGSFLDDRFAPGGERLLEPAAALMGSLLLRPALENGSFRADYAEGERTNLIDRIRAQVNDKRQYSVVRISQLMCQNEPFGVDKYGDEATAAALTGSALWTRYQALLAEAPVELYYCGGAPLERVEAAFLAALSGLPASGVRKTPETLVEAHAAPGAPRMFEERLDVTQGKLSLGFRTGGVNVSHPSMPALMVFNAVYGGTTTSKLFMNVREKLSLCYYASSMLEWLKGIMLVSSGVEFEKYEKAKAEILAQLESVRAGDITPAELEGARRSVVSGLKTTLDAHGKLEEFWLSQAVAGLTEDPARLADRVEAVTLEQVVDMAKAVELDAVYFLSGKEA